MAKAKVTVRYREVVGGTYVTKEYAEKHKSSTVRETNKSRKAAGK